MCLIISLSDKIPNALNTINNGTSILQWGILTFNVLPFKISLLENLILQFLGVLNPIFETDFT